MLCVVRARRYGCGNALSLLVRPYLWYNTARFPCCFFAGFFIGAFHLRGFSSGDMLSYGSAVVWRAVLQGHKKRNHTQVGTALWVLMLRMLGCVFGQRMRAHRWGVGICGGLTHSH